MGDQELDEIRKHRLSEMENQFLRLFYASIILIICLCESDVYEWFRAQCSVE